VQNWSPENVASWKGLEGQERGLTAAFGKSCGHLAELTFHLAKNFHLAKLTFHLADFFHLANLAFVRELHEHWFVERAQHECRFGFDPCLAQALADWIAGGNTRSPGVIAGRRGILVSGLVFQCLRY
jgi:hypothetical protein